MISQPHLRLKIKKLQLHHRNELACIRSWEFWKWTKKGRLENELLVLDLLLEDDYIFISVIPKSIYNQLKEL